MKISQDDILTNGLHSAQMFANKKILDGENKDMFEFTQVIQSKYSLQIITSLVMGSIEEYHNQLRDKLLESNIDIGEMDYESTNLMNQLSNNVSHDDLIQMLDEQTL